jgi:hypothetical protein
MGDATVVWHAPSISLKQQGGGGVAAGLAGARWAGADCSWGGEKKGERSGPEQAATMG